MVTGPSYDNKIIEEVHFSLYCRHGKHLSRRQLAYWTFISANIWRVLTLVLPSFVVLQVHGVAFACPCVSWYLARSFQREARVQSFYARKNQGSGGWWITATIALGRPREVRGINDVSDILIHPWIHPQISDKYKR